ncbi:MAG: hypothetical protein EU536_04485 [Promethearchaeota archaeon]|nr:MAG: hypothetical protein EU536_04485 [Candidatus Lokiarchaeota archaeon]
MQKYLDFKSNETGFRVDQLERQFHVTKILALIENDGFLRSNTVIKGGTAIQGAWCKLIRLSYDIDLDFIGGEKLAVMNEKRPLIISRIKQISEENNYKVKITPPSHIIERLELRYESIRNTSGLTRIEINFLNRIPLINVVEKEFHNIFPEKIKNFSIITYDLHELLAMKITTFIQRKASRDFFDISSLINLPTSYLNFYDLKILIIIYLLMIPRQELAGLIQIEEFESVSIEILKILNTLNLDAIKREINKELLRTYPLDINKTKKKIVKCLSRIPPLNKNDKKMWDEFFSNGKFTPDHLLEESSRINRDLISHPSILRRINHDHKS